MRTNVHDATRTDSGLPYAGPKLWAALVALVVGTGALAFLTMPDPMTIHWRLGLDGAVTERTASRSTASLFFVVAGVLTFALALAFVRLRNRSTEMAAVYDLAVTGVLAALAAIQVLLLILNALLA